MASGKLATEGSLAGFVSDQDKLGNELSEAVSWLASVGALVVMERDGAIHIYRGQIHKNDTKRDGDSGADVLLRTIKATRAAHGS